MRVFSAAVFATLAPGAMAARLSVLAFAATAAALNNGLGATPAMGCVWSQHAAAR